MSDPQKKSPPAWIYFALGVVLTFVVMHVEHRKEVDAHMAEAHPEEWKEIQAERREEAQASYDTPG